MFAFKRQVIALKAASLNDSLTGSVPLSVWAVLTVCPYQKLQKLDLRIVIHTADRKILTCVQAISSLLLRSSESFPHCLRF